MSVDASKPLKNSRREAFAQNIATPRADGSYLSQGEAYTAAGYSATGKTAIKAASRLLTIVDISARVDYLKARAAEESVATAADILKYWTEVMFGELTTETNTKGGVVELPPSFGDRTKASENLAKYHGMLVDKSIVTLEKSPADMTDEELEAALRARDLL